ncbi:MAG: helix-turn-helix transcriptional regulator [Lachnospiraceae bacterium]|nr:helix-turn-helix transcriptional regulator [Lachnospiraceae bacterium]
MIHNANYLYDVSTYTTKDHELHCHNFYEVYYFLEGDVECLVEGQKYNPTPNSMLLLAPHVFHGMKIKSTRPYRRFILYFNPEFLSMERRAFLLSAFPSPIKNPQQKVFFEDIDKFHFSHYFETLEHYRHLENPRREQMISIGMEALLTQIIYMSDTESVLSTDSRLDTVSQITWYLNKNLKENITLDQISQKFFISKHYLNRIFRKATGTTVFDYLLHKRISLAQQLLTGGMNAQDAAIQSGFSDYSTFYRAYVRILGHAPSCDKGGGFFPDNAHEKGAETIMYGDPSHFYQ